MSKIRVLVVDDSAFARKVIREVLSRDPGIEVVGIARDGLDALEKIVELRPEVVTLDLIMPDLDGIGLLKVIPKDIFPKVVVVTVSGAETEIALEALTLGAVNVVTKPTAQATDRLYELSTELVTKVKEASLARPRPTLPSEPPEPLSTPGKTSEVRLVVIGTSTGGPQALTSIFRALPAGLSFPVAVALHIPAGYTAPLAARISEGSAVRLTEAADGMRLWPGEGYIAPGGRHLRVRADGDRLFAVVSSSPLNTLHHPSVDELFTSAAEQLGSAAVGIILTGMGSDGTIGAGAIQRRGGRVVVEAAESCVVYGMPRAALEAGFAASQVKLTEVPALLMGL